MRYFEKMKELLIKNLPHSEFIHFFLLRSHFDLFTLLHFLLHFCFFYLSFRSRNRSSFKHFMEFFIHLFNASWKKKYILVSFFNHQISSLATFSLISHINNNQFILLVLESIELWYYLIARNICSRVVDAFFDSP